MNCGIISDSYIINHLITTTLKPYGYNIDRIKFKNFNVRNINPNRINLFIINCIQQIDEGVSILKQLNNQYPDIKSIAITSKRDWKDRVRLFDSGVDDVIDHPFSLQEFVSRVKNLNSRSETKSPIRYYISGAILDTQRRSLMLNDKDVEIRKKEFNILEYLARNSNRCVSRNELLDNLWDYRNIASSNTIDVHISSIRKKLGSRSCIKTVHGFGYRINEDSKNGIAKDIESSQ